MEACAGEGATSSPTGASIAAAMTMARVVCLTPTIPQIPASCFFVKLRWTWLALEPQNRRQPVRTKASLESVTKTFPCHGTVAFVQHQIIGIAGLFLTI